MKKIGVIYGSTSGTCEGIAHQIAKVLDVAALDVIDVAKITTAQLNSYDVLLLGSSTWGFGDLQDDWYNGVNKLKAATLKEKQVGFFGCGDSDSYPDSFCDAMGLIYQEIAGSGCNIVGKLPTDGYNYDASLAEVDGEFIGLVLDDVNDSDLTEGRIVVWAELIKSQI